MNILMMTNTFTPHVGGVARSIESFSEQFRQQGVQVKVVAPSFDNMPTKEPDVIRIPALRKFNHTDFSVSLPIPHLLREEVETFEPDVIHSHHPFLLGGTALRIAHTHGLPLVFTHHTRYEDYTHNIPIDSPGVRRFVERLATNYANTCDHVFVPSESMASMIKKRGVTKPIDVVPTGVMIEKFSDDSGQSLRESLGIPSTAFVVGHLGRLTKEKNIPFLMQALAEFVQRLDPSVDARIVIFGEGPMRATIEAYFRDQRLTDRLHLAGVVEKQDVPAAFHAMDVFAFASQSETQGMVITEAMASSVPVVAVDAPGVREVVKDGTNGALLAQCDTHEFVDALVKLSTMSVGEFQIIKNNALQTAKDFSMEKTANKAISLYSALRDYDATHRHLDYPIWTETLKLFESEWEILMNTIDAAQHAIRQEDPI